MATSLQDHAPLSTMSQKDVRKFFYLNNRIGFFGLLKVEKEVIECMNRALKYLEVEINCSRSDRYSLSKYRAGTILSTFSNFLTSTTIMFIFSCNSIIILSYLLSVNSIKIEKIQDALIVNSKSNLQSNCSACICQCMPYPIIIIIMLLCQLLYK
jgi:hypothetical protein